MLPSLSLTLGVRWYSGSSILGFFLTADDMFKVAERFMLRL